MRRVRTARAEDAAKVEPRPARVVPGEAAVQDVKAAREGVGEDGAEPALAEGHLRDAVAEEHERSRRGVPRGGGF